MTGVYSTKAVSEVFELVRVCLLAFVLIAAASAQSPDAPKMAYKSMYAAQPPVPATVVFNGMGSFSAEGMGNFTFTVDGTVLMNQVTAKRVIVSPGLRVEYGPDTREIGGKRETRTVYHGKGTVQIVEGTIHAIIFFGDKCSGKFDGVGRFRFSGEGTFTIKHDKTNKGQINPWFESGIDTYVPGVPPMKPAAPPRNVPGQPHGPGDGHDH